MVHMNDKGPVVGAGKKKVSWARRIAIFAVGGALLAILVAMVATTLARYGVVSKLGGFGVFMQMMYVAGASAAIGVVALILAAIRRSSGRKTAILAIVLSLGLVGVIYALVINPARSHPPLHDVTTDLNDPPQFRTLALREDNLVPFASEEEWRAAHRNGYPDIEPIIIDRAPEEVLANARALAEERGWEIAAYDAASGHMEATAYAGYIRFMDDVVVEVTPVQDGSTRVDMRSVSRVGVSDLGYNAARIEEFLADLREAE